MATALVEIANHETETENEEEHHLDLVHHQRDKTKIKNTDIAQHHVHHLQNDRDHDQGQTTTEIVRGMTKIVHEIRGVI